MKKIYGVVFNKGELTNSWTVRECYSNKLTIRWNEICSRNQLNTFQQTDETGLDAFTCWVSAHSCNEAHDKAREYYNKYYIAPEPPKYSGKFIFSFHSDLIESDICSPADDKFDDYCSQNDKKSVIIDREEKMITFYLIEYSEYRMRLYQRAMNRYVDFKKDLVYQQLEKQMPQDYQISIKEFYRGLNDDLATKQEALDNDNCD